jgi:hypothetical protein
MDANQPVLYWAAKPVAEIAAEIESKFNDYKKWGSTTDYFDRIVTSFDAFYGFNSNGTLRVSRNSDDVAEIKVNHYKSLIRRLHILVTENKLAFQPRAKNSDSKSQVESDLARGITEYYADEKGMNDIFSHAVLGALIMLEQYVHAPWDFAEGYELTADGQQTVKSGDQKFEVFSALDVAKATTTPTSPWYIIRKKVNKYDEAALHPDFANEILSCSCDVDQYDMSRRGIQSQQDQLGADEDMCWKYMLYHARTPALPEGRQVEVIASQVLADSPLKYKKVPVFRLSAGDVLGTGFGDSPGVDLLPLQQALDAIFSGTVTNALNNSVQLIFCQDPNLVTRKLSDGQTLVTASSPPVGLNLTGNNNENHKLIDVLMQHQQLLSGVNDVARGNPSASLKSGTSLAVILAQAIQYVSDLQKGYARLAGDVATCLIANIQTFASEEMTAFIVGASRKGQVKKFKRNDVMDIERVSVDLGNPLTQSFAGRNEMAELWTSKGILKDPKQIISFQRTGEIDSATENPFSDSLLIRDENEQIRKGINPAVLITDNHAEHIIEHKAIMSSVERDDPTILEAWTAHVQEHLDMIPQVPPALAAVLSGQPLPPPQGAAPDPNGAPLPTVDGARMPNVPPEAPAQTQAAYQQALNAVPPEGVA